MANRDIWDEIELVGKGEHLDEEMFEYLSAYADGECTAKERRLVEAYLAESADARAQLADLRMQAAIASEGFEDPPEWLRGAILSKTVDKPRLKWPFAAAITAATAGAAALAIYWSMPSPATGSGTELLANVVNVEPSIEPRILNAPNKVNERAPVPAVTQKVVSTNPAEKQTRKDGFTLASKPIEAEKAEEKSVSPPVTPSASAEREPDPDLTYAVVEHGSGRFESKQPDVFDAEPPNAEPSRTNATSNGAVLPDAREKLRDKVRKMNEEKLEIEGDDK